MRRGRGEGAIFRAGDGRWVARIELGPGPDGRRRRREHRARTRQEALAWLDRARRALAEGRPLPPERLRLAEYLRDWIAGRAALGELRGRTVESYRQIIERHLVPGLGQCRLTELRPAAIRRYLAAKLTEGQSPTSVKYHHAVLASALAAAVRDGLLATNPARLVAPPRVERPEVRPLELAEVRRLLAAARGSRLEALIVLAATTGMRQGELLGLRWVDVDLEGGTLRVNQTVQRIGGRVQAVPPKTTRSRRTLALPALACEALREHRDRQEFERRRAERLGCWEGESWGLVFCTEVGTPLAKETLRRHWRALLARAGLAPMPFHGLRHTAASLLHATGSDLRMVQEVLGHSQISTTAETYTHVFARVQREAAQRMDAALRVAPPGGGSGDRLGGGLGDSLGDNPRPEGRALPGNER